MEFFSVKLQNIHVYQKGQQYIEKYLHPMFHRFILHKNFILNNIENNLQWELPDQQKRN